MQNIIITNGKGEQKKEVEERIKKLEFGPGEEIFIERRFEEKLTRQETSFEDLVLRAETVLRKG